MKKLVIALMAFALVISLAGCGGGGGGSSEDYSKGDDGKTLKEQNETVYKQITEMKNSVQINKDYNVTQAKQAADQFTTYIDPNTEFGQDKITKSDVGRRINNVLNNNKLDVFTFSFGKTAEITSTKVVQYLNIAIHGKNKTTGEEKGTKSPMTFKFVWSKIGDDWLITEGFENKSYWRP